MPRRGQPVDGSPVTYRSSQSVTGPSFTSSIPSVWTFESDTDSGAMTPSVLDTLAVCSVLLVLQRHLGGAIRLGTSGSLRGGWGSAARLVRETIGDCGQLVQHENGLLRWVDAPEYGFTRSVRSSAS